MKRLLSAWKFGRSIQEKTSEPMLNFITWQPRGSYHWYWYI